MSGETEELCWVVIEGENVCRPCSEVPEGEPRNLAPSGTPIGTVQPTDPKIIKKPGAGN